MDGAAILGGQVPIAVTAIYRLFHAPVKADIAAQIMAVSNVVGIGQDFRLPRKPLRPRPFLLQFTVKLIGILQTFNVAAGARIAVPIPGAANPVTGFNSRRRQAHLAQAIEQIHASKAGPNNNHIDTIRHCFFPHDAFSQSPT